MIHQWLTFLAAPSLIQICFGVWIKNHKLNKIRCINTCQNIKSPQCWIKSVSSKDHKFVNVCAFCWVHGRISIVVKCVKSFSYFCDAWEIFEKSSHARNFPFLAIIKKKIVMFYFFILKSLHFYSFLLFLKILHFLILAKKRQFRAWELFTKFSHAPQNQQKPVMHLIF